MNEVQIEESLKTILQNGHVTVTYIDIANIIASIAGLVLVIGLASIPYIIYIADKGGNNE